LFAAIAAGSRLEILEFTTDWGVINGFLTGEEVVAREEREQGKPLIIIMITAPVPDAVVNLDCGKLFAWGAGFSARGRRLHRHDGS
jgi:hypothetical protein